MLSIFSCVFWSFVRLLDTGNFKSCQQRIRCRCLLNKVGSCLNRHFFKEDIQMANRLTNTWKDAQHHLLLEKCKSKPQWDIISHQSEWRSWKSTDNKCWRGCGERLTLLLCWWECKLVHPLWRTVWRSLRKLQIELPYNPAIYCWTYTLRKSELKETHVPQCLLWHCLQWPEYGSNLDVHWQTNG